MVNENQINDYKKSFQSKIENRKVNAFDPVSKASLVGKNFFTGKMFIVDWQISEDEIEGKVELPKKSQNFHM